MKRLEDLQKGKNTLGTNLNECRTRLEKLNRDFLTVSMIIDKCTKFCLEGYIAAPKKLDEGLKKVPLG